MVDLILASRSPRRAALLRAAGLYPTIMPGECDESPKPDEPAVDLARRLARAKLEAVQTLLSTLNGPTSNGPTPAVVLAADTVVWRAKDAAPLGKPDDREDAHRMLRTLLDAQTHWVTTGWAAAHPTTDAVMINHQTTQVWMRPLDEPELVAYLDTEAWRDKAGGYGIQDHAASWITRIEGSYTNVVGLPVAQVLMALRPWGIVADQGPRR